MLARKNKLNKFNPFFLDLAFEQAKINLGSTKKNPSVGCIIEKNGSIISSGRTSINGRPHAERNALNKNINFNGSNLYVTLEPCSHYGNTPPCTNIIIKKKIKNVFFSTFDFDKRTAKLSKKILKKYNINVKKVSQYKKNKNFYLSYIQQKNKKLPFVEGKIAISNDYFTINKKSKWITNDYSRKRVHLLRSKYNAILTTSKTLNDDNALLNCRIEGLERKSPDLIIIDKNLKIKRNLKIFSIKNRRIYIVTESKNKLKRQFLKRKGIKILTISNIKNISNFKKILFYFNNIGFSRILIESGLEFINFLIEAKIMKYIYIFKSNYNLKNNGYNNVSNKYIKSIKLKNKMIVNLYEDQLFKERIN